MENEESLQIQKSRLLKERDHLLDIKLNLQKEVLFAPTQDFQTKHSSQSETMSVAEKLNHKLSDARFISSLECHMLCGMRILNYSSTKLIVQFQPSYMERILADTYAVHLSTGDNGAYEVSKYHLPHSVSVDPLLQQWTPLKKEHLREFLMEIRLQVNAFHHRKNQIQQLKEWANEKKIPLKIFHPLSLRCLIITLKCDDNSRLGICTQLDLILQYSSNCYLPNTLEIEATELEEDDFAEAKKQFSAFKLYSLREAFQICCMKEERNSLMKQDTVMNSDTDPNLEREDIEAHDKKSTSNTPQPFENRRVSNSKRISMSHMETERESTSNQEKIKPAVAIKRQKDVNLMSKTPAVQPKKLRAKPNKRRRKVKKK